MRLRNLTAAALVVAFTGLAAAAPPEPTDRPGRFTMQPADGGFLRLDTVTGDVSLCARAAGTFECRPVKDDRDLQAEMARLSAENKELRAEVKRLEDLLAADAKPAPKFELPKEEDVDKALSYLERMVKKFRDKMKGLEQPSDPPKGKGTQL